MNILPKKSWHVRNKDNIERVRKDEEKAAEEEKERQRRIAFAESEARTDFLRDKARKRRPDSDEPEAPTASLKHINFFQDLEDGKKLGGKNADSEKEKKEEKEKQEKAIGLLTHLGQGSFELEGKTPWYLSQSLREKAKPTTRSSTDEQNKEEIDVKRKRVLDPMVSVVKYVEQTEKVHRVKGSTSSSGKDHSRHRKHRNKDDSVGSFGPQKSKTIEELRAERLKREQVERMRQNELLANARGEKDPSEAKDDVVDERNRRYNSQFNPDLVALQKMRTLNRGGGKRY